MLRPNESIFRGLKALRFLLAIGAIVFGVFTLLAQITPCTGAPFTPGHDRFDPRLGSIRSLDASEEYIRGELPTNATPEQTAAAVEDFVQRRFSHGFSEYTFCDNWLAYIAGGLWYDLKVPIDPEEILDHPQAMCSQSTLVIRALLERFHIPNAAITFWSPEHMAAAGYINGKWALYDGDLEPNKRGIVSFDDLLDGNVLPALYNSRPGSAANLGTQFQNAARTGQIKLQDENRVQGTRGRLFQKLTDIASRFGWLVFALLWFFSGKTHYLAFTQGKKSKELIAGKTPSQAAVPPWTSSQRDQLGS